MQTVHHENSAEPYLLMFGSTNMSIIRIFAGARNVTHLTEMTTTAKLLCRVRRTTLDANRCLLLLVDLTLQVQLVSLAGTIQFIHVHFVTRKKNGCQD